MKDEAYVAPISSDSSAASSVAPPSFFSRCWHGEVKLWQAFWLAHVLGYVAVLFAGLAIGYLVLVFFGARLPGFFYAAVIGCYGIFAVVTLWRNSPNPKVSILGALVKLWALLFAYYLIRTCLRFIAVF